VGSRGLVSKQSSLGRRIGVGRTAEIFEWEKGYVVKLFLKGFSRETMQREARVGRVVNELGLPVPKVIELIEVDGRYGIVFERVGSGRTMLQELGAKPWLLSSLFRVFTDLHLEMHRRSVPELPPLRRRLAERIRRITSADFRDDLRELAERAKATALAELEELPEDDKLCHGDFHPDNIIMSPRGPVIIDWVDAAKGDPAADVARTRLLISVGAPVEGRISSRRIDSVRKRALSLYLKLYLERSHISLESIDAWGLPVALARITEGIPGERDQLMVFIKSCLGRQFKHTSVGGGT
jgi:aminoglycoside phosphotransferase (APT) family kinase protein